MWHFVRQLHYILFCYACPLWHPGLTKELSKDIKQVQKCCFKVMYPSFWYSKALSESGLDLRRDFVTQKTYSEKIRSKAPPRALIPPIKVSHNISGRNNFLLLWKDYLKAVTSGISLILLKKLIFEVSLVFVVNILSQLNSLGSIFLYFIFLDTSYLVTFSSTYNSLRDLFESINHYSVNCFY